MNSNNKKVFITKQISLMAILFIVKLIGFAKQVILAAIFGTTFEVDVYYLSSGFVGGIAQMIFGAVGVAILPIYTQIIVNKGRDESSKYISKIIKVSLLFSTLLAAIIFLTAPLLSSIITSGYSTEQLAFVTLEIRIFDVSIIFFSLSNIYMAILDAEKVFIPYRLSGIINSLSFIAIALFIGNSYGGNALIVASIVSWGLQLINIYCFARKHYTFFFDAIKVRAIFKDKDIRTLAFLVLPMLVGNAIIEINDLVDKSISTGLTVGALSSLSYAQILKEFVVFIFVTSLSSVIFSYVSMYTAQQKNQEVSKLINKSMRILIIILIPISIYFVVYSDDIVKLAFMRGEFGQDALELCSSALKGYSIGFVFIAVRECMNKVHYSYQDTKQPLFNGTIAVIINIICSLVLSKFIGITGISLSTSVSAFIACVLSLKTVKKHNRDIKILSSIKSCIQTLVSIAFVIIVYLLTRVHKQSCFINLMLGLLIVFVPYFTCLFLMKNEEICYLLSIVRNEEKRIDKK